MVGLRKLKGNYYARVKIPRAGLPPKDKLISLRTKYQREASIRRNEVAKYEADIKAGVNIKFPWQTGKGLPEVVRYTVEEAIQDYLKARKGDGLRETTVEMYERALNHFVSVIRKETPVERIGTEHIEAFKLKFLTEHSSTTRNINLRAIRTFLYWLKERGKTHDVPRVKQVRTGKTLPIYLSSVEFAEILKAVANQGKMHFRNPDDSQHFQRAFHFYRETGCRLSEPFYGILDGNFLVIEADNAKTHQTRELELTPELLKIAYELKERFEQYPGMNKRDFVKRYSAVFRKACKLAGVGGKKFHSFRHTFAVRRYLQTRDLYLVAKEMGHSSIKTTEIYSQFSIRHLKQDFPDLSAGFQTALKVSNMHVWDTDSGDTRLKEIAIS